MYVASEPFHIDTADGDIPVTAILTSASLHDSQAAIPLMRVTGGWVTYLYDLADAAYCGGIIREVSRQEGHVPLNLFSSVDFARTAATSARERVCGTRGGSPNG